MACMTCLRSYTHTNTHTPMHSRTHKFKLIVKIVLKGFYSKIFISDPQSKSHYSLLLTHIKQWAMSGNRQWYEKEGTFTGVYRQAEASHTGKHPGIYRMTNNYPDTNVNSAQAIKNGDVQCCYQMLPLLQHSVAVACRR